MAENNFATLNLTEQNTTNGFKRKFEKLKSKFFELFFVTSAANLKTIEQLNTKRAQLEKSVSTNTLNSSMLISNCYYGYKSNLIENFDDNSNRNSSASLNSPLTSQLINSSSSSNKNVLISSMSSASSTISSDVVTTSDFNTSDTYEIINATGYYDSNENGNCIKENNPFLNKELTDLIHFNNDLNLLNSHFEAYLDLIDDQDNFFNMNFMINYISYIILKNIKSESILKQTSNGDSNLLKEISREIYLESENEPCGLKGCKLSVNLEASNERSLITQFRFDSTCSITTFELNVTIKQFKDQTGASNQSSILSLKRLLSTNGTKQKLKQKANNLEQIVYLESNHFDLLKRKLY